MNYAWQFSVVFKRTKMKKRTLPTSEFESSKTPHDSSRESEINRMRLFGNKLN